MKVALDASLAVKWFVEEEGREAARVLLRSPHQIVAPSLLLVEVSNVLVTKARRGQVPAGVVVVAPAMLKARRIAFCPAADLLDEAVAFSIANGFHPIYDLLYAVLARREGAPLATADRRLAELAGRMGIPLWAP